jgi:hypothetical protein
MRHNAFGSATRQLSVTVILAECKIGFGFLNFLAQRRRNRLQRLRGPRFPSQKIVPCLISNI